MTHGIAAKNLCRLFGLSHSNPMSFQVFHNVQVAVQRRPISTAGGAVNAVSAKITNNVKMAAASRAVGTAGRAMDAMSSQVLDHFQVAS